MGNFNNNQSLGSLFINVILVLMGAITSFADNVWFNGERATALVLLVMWVLLTFNCASRGGEFHPLASSAILLTIGWIVFFGAIASAYDMYWISHNFYNWPVRLSVYAGATTMLIVDRLDIHFTILEKMRLHRLRVIKKLNQPHAGSGITKGV